jgi:hypothetical protein
MARDADGEVWVERGGQLTTLSPHRKVRFDAMRLTLNHVVVGLASSDEQERVEHGRVAKVEFDPGPYRPGRRWPSSESCRGVGRPVTHVRGHTPRRACGRLALEAWGTPIDKRLSLCCWARCRDAARRTGAQSEARQDDEYEPAVGCAHTRLARALAGQAASRNRSRAGWRRGHLRGVGRLLGQQEITLGDASSLPWRGALIVLWIQAVPAAAMLDHSCAVS